MLDVVRVSQSEYQLFLGNPLIGGTVVTLTADQEIVSGILNKPADKLVEYLVVAQIDSIAPLILELKSCHGQECSGVNLESTLGITHHISGKAIAIEAEHLR